MVILSGRWMETLELKRVISMPVQPFNSHDNIAGGVYLSDQMKLTPLCNIVVHICQQIKWAYL